tara:strand:- start:2505 stop:3206 length:702 start_codon:yes stop_codon:yes gene_type:complete
MSSPRTVKQVAKETGWLNEKFLKHLAKNYSGKEFTLESLREDPVISKFMEPSKKTKKEAKPRAASSSPMKFLKENPETSLKFVQENPKKAATKSHSMYEKYKVATTYAEFKDLGGGTEQLLWDYRKGYLQIEGGDIENFTPEEKKPKSSKPKAKKSTPKKEKKEKKPVEVTPDPVSEELEEDQTPSLPKEEPEQEPVQDTPVEKDDSDDSDDEGGFNPFNLTADDSDDGEDSD